MNVNEKLRTRDFLPLERVGMSIQTIFLVFERVFINSVKFIHFKNTSYNEIGKKNGFSAII